MITVLPAIPGKCYKNDSGGKFRCHTVNTKTNSVCLYPKDGQVNDNLLSYSFEDFIEQFVRV